ncbi:MAG: hypothetical protein ACI9DQ_000552 [Glaciecola sp.]|jgi:hypothetical protein
MNPSKKIMRQQNKGKLKSRSWFEFGGRHALENRLADLSPVLSTVDLSSLNAADIGAAEGDITQWIAQQFATVEAHEYTDKLYSQLEEKFRDTDRVSTHQTDITKNPLQGFYDIVFFLGVLHCFTSEPIRRRAMEHCLEHSKHLCITRTAIRDFRQRDNRRMERAHRYTTLRTFLDATCDKFDICIIDNGYRGEQDLRLGDLIVFRRRDIRNPLPTLHELFGATEGYIDQEAIQESVISDPTELPTIHLRG